jgi:hypothetical protein
MALADNETQLLVGKKLDDHLVETLKESTCNILGGCPVIH